MRPKTSPLAAIAATTVALAAAPAAAWGEAEYVPGELIVRFKGEEQGRTYALPGGVGVRTAARALGENPRVRHAVPNYVAHASQSEGFIPNDPGKSGAPSGWRDQQWNFLPDIGVDAPRAWANLIALGKPGGRGVKVAVLDTGVAYSDRGRFRRSPDLARSRFLRGHDFVDDDRLPMDENGHGTHVASTIAERANNGVALTGLAYSARIMPMRVLDRNGAGEADAIARAIRFAARRGAHVINLSLEFDSSVVASQIPEIISAVRYANRKRALVVAASGNEGAPRVAYPARAPRVISVGATTEHKCQADYSNEGRGLDIVAPGGGRDALISGDPSCRPFDEDGRDIFQLTYTGSGFRNFGYPGGYQGTSMAAPHVSATAALLIASGILGTRPTPRAIEDRLKRTARDFGTPGYDTRYGWGMLDAGAATDPAVVTAAIHRP